MAHNFKCADMGIIVIVNNESECNSYDAQIKELKKGEKYYVENSYGYTNYTDDYG